jgi:hypothetical protein
VVRREELPAKAPRALSVEQQRRVLRMAEHVSARDRADPRAAAVHGATSASVAPAVSLSLPAGRGDRLLNAQILFRSSPDPEGAVSTSPHPYNSLTSEWAA